MRIALAQLNPIVGDILGNCRRIAEAIEIAQVQGVDMVVFSEMAVLGYPPRDLLLRTGVLEAAEHAVLDIAHLATDMIVAVGHPRRAPGPRGVRNSVSLCAGGHVVAVYDKQLLPGYDVFDEDRWFDPGDSTGIFEIEGTSIGILCCEDLWRAADTTSDVAYASDPLRAMVDAEPDVTIVLNASPFVAGKGSRHVHLVRRAAQRLRGPVVSVNQVGGNDDLVFDGRSLVANADGAIVGLLPAWEEAVQTVDLDQTSEVAVERDRFEDEVLQALVLGTRDYVQKTGHDRVVLGLSGGIDSALTATIAAAALGGDAVTGVMMPSQYSSEGSIRDAEALVNNLGLQGQTVSIEGPHASIVDALSSINGLDLRGLPDENIQARLRGVQLMAISNATGALVLATGNKSELAVGYSTLYGDMCGAISVIGDLLKTQVYALSRWINANHADLGFEAPPIPEASITKPPSAELRPDQTDQDSLPPYEILDEIISRYIDDEQSIDQIVAALPDVDHDTVIKWAAAIDRAQYKREQAAVILKVSPRAFGRGRVYPIVMRDTSAEMPGGLLRRTAAETT